MLDLNYRRAGRRSLGLEKFAITETCSDAVDAPGRTTRHDAPRRVATMPRCWCAPFRQAQRAFGPGHHV